MGFFVLFCFFGAFSPQFSGDSVILVTVDQEINVCKIIFIAFIAHIELLCHFIKKQKFCMYVNIILV